VTRAKRPNLICVRPHDIDTHERAVEVHEGSPNFCMERPYVREWLPRFR
jgi:hypothetical protein